VAVRRGETEPVQVINYRCEGGNIAVLIFVRNRPGILFQFSNNFLSNFSKNKIHQY
jgi:hypothetical protein